MDRNAPPRVTSQDWMSLAQMLHDLNTIQLANLVVEKELKQLEQEEE